MHLVPAPAVRLMKRRVLSRPGVNRGQLHTRSSLFFVFLFSWLIYNGMKCKREISQGNKEQQSTKNQTVSWVNEVNKRAKEKGRRAFSSFLYPSFSLWSFASFHSVIELYCCSLCCCLSFN